MGLELGTAELGAAEELEAACHGGVGADDGAAIGIGEAACHGGVGADDGAAIGIGAAVGTGVGAAVGTAAPRACV